MLKLTKPMMHGPAVKRLQEHLEILGHCIDVDGIYGPKTANAVNSIQWRNGIKSDGIYGPQTAELFDKLIKAKHNTVIFAGASDIIDISDSHPVPKLWERERSLSSITGVTWHQTGCSMPSDPMGWSRVNAHYGLTQEGLPILINKPTDFIWHAQGLSKKTIGIEIEGNYPGVTNNPKTLWRGGGGPHSLNDKMIAGAVSIVEDILSRVAFDKGKYFYAHRQSSPTRRADPGQEIWTKIVAPLAVRYGFEIVPDYTKGKGRKLPVEWGYGAKY